MVINDFVGPVIGKIRNRTEFTGILPYYIALAILDLTENYQFAELETTGPLANFVPNLAEYPIQGYDPNGIQGNPFINATDHRLTFVKSWFIYFNTSGQITPGIDTGYEINKRALRVVEPMSKILGIPSVYTFFGDKRNKGKIIVGQMPDNPYACQMRYQKEHPFDLPKSKFMQAHGDPELAAILGNSEVWMPYDWTDIIVYYSAEKVCDDVGMNEIAMNYHQKLFGYKDKRGSEMPGLITEKIPSEERNALFNSRAMKPVVNTYSRR